jgi:hypothetical protein
VASWLRKLDCEGIMRRCGCCGLAERHHSRLSNVPCSTIATPALWPSASQARTLP